MPSFKYRLQPLLEVKLERKEEMELALARRQRELASEREALTEGERVHEDLAARLVEALRARLAAGAGVQARALAQHTDYLRGLTEDVTAARGAASAQRVRVREFQDRVADARRQLVEAAREVDILNKHRERLEKRFLQLAERKETLEQDEMGGIIFNQKRQAYESSF